MANEPTVGSLFPLEFPCQESTAAGFKADGDVKIQGRWPKNPSRRGAQRNSCESTLATVSRCAHVTRWYSP
jgi:hypothetical protein